MACLQMLAVLGIKTNTWISYHLTII